MANSSPAEVSKKDFDDLKQRCQIIFDADPSQRVNDFAIRRFLRAFKTVNDAFTAIIKYNNWRREFGVEKISENDAGVQAELATGKIKVLDHRDHLGRPIVYLAAKLHVAAERDRDELTRFIVFVLERACSRCEEEIIDNICIVFDLQDFALANMDYQFVKSLIWLLGKYYPERLGTCLIINSSYLFSGCWTVIRPWLNEVTASKVTFVNSEDQLRGYLIPESLPCFSL